MLTVPAHSRIGSTTVYRDDTDFFRFYAVPEAPRLRTGADGKPVLLLVIYSVSDEERATHPELPTGGGHLVLDTQFEVPADELLAIETALAPLVAADWERLRSGTPEEQTRAGVQGTTEPPKVLMTTPTYTGGSVNLNAPQAASLVAARVAEGEPSLLTGNVASFSLDLTPMGAGFVEQALAAAPDGPDAAPLQVSYDLTFWARLPAASVHLEVDAERLYTYVNEQMTSRGIENCTPYEYETSAVDSESLVLSGAVTVQIDTGSGSLPDDVVAELRGYGFDTLKQLVESTFFTEQTATPQLPAGAPPAPPLVWGERHLVRKQFDSQTMSIKLDLEQRTVVQWPIHPTGTLRSLLGGSAGHVRRVRLGDDFFANLEVEVEVFTDFERVDHVDVELEYRAAGPDGAEQQKGTLLTLDADAPLRGWTVGLIGASRSFRYRYRAVLRGAAAGPFTEWADHDKPRLPLAIAAPGIVTAEAVAGSIDFAHLVSSAQVRFAYEDPAQGVPRDEGVVVLTAGAPTARYLRRIDVPATGRLQHRVRFFLHSGDVTDESEWEPVLGERVVVNQPRESVLSVRLAPTGTGWLAEAKVLVDLEYSDPENDLHVAETFELGSLGDAATWRVYLQDQDRRGYRYRWLASFSDGSVLRQPWTDNPGDPVLPVAVTRAGIDLVVHADLLDFSVCPLTEVSVTHTPTGRSTTLLLRERVGHLWHVDAPEGSPESFTYRVTHFPVNRDPVELPERSEKDRMIVVPPYRPDDLLRVSILGWLVDFGVSPIVGVDLLYEDADNDVRLTGSFSVNDSARGFEWEVPLVDPAHTDFAYRLTYFNADGSPRVGEWVPTDVPRVVVPAMSAS